MIIDRHHADSERGMVIAAAQVDVLIGNRKANLEKIIRWIHEARGRGARLIVFPECALTGYCYDSYAEAFQEAESVPGPATDTIGEICRKYNIYVSFGILECWQKRLYNTAVLIGPEGILDRYRKTHLPFLGVDRYTDYGNQPYRVAKVENIMVGQLICYDGGFPEPARCLTLLGADLIILPTNWPRGAEAAAEYVVNTRALENAIYFAAVNRIGEERGTKFIGKSRISDPWGKTIAQADGEHEALMLTEIHPQISRQKHQIRVAGKNEVDRIADRRPELYELIVAPSQRLRPRDKHSDQAPALA